MDIYPNKQRLLDMAREAILNFDEELVSRAWDFSKTAHGDQPRTSGQPYFSHPVSVAYTLITDVNCDTPTIVAALLHDVVEDTSTTIKDIERQFGSEIAGLVEGVTKLAPLDTPPLKAWTTERSRVENLLKLFVSIKDDPRVALIKLADRYHNLITLGALSIDRQRRIAEESLQVFAPLAEALGVGVLQSRIQDLAFRHLEPKIYKELAEKVEERREVFGTVQELAVELLEHELDKEKISAVVYARTKEIYSIYRKMTKMDLDFEGVYDIIGIRALVDTKEDCYNVKSVVDRLGSEIKYDDYIDTPRNAMGYQSLHKVIIDKPGGTLIEIQIRTHEMHDRAERGPAAHWIYKMGGASSDPFLIKRVGYLREALEYAIENRDDIGSFEEILEVIRETGLAPRVNIFTPGGDIVSLPQGSNPIDFAYRIHTQLGHECCGAFIDGRNVGLDYVLKEGDTVEIVRRKGGGPKLEWLMEGRLKTPGARHKVRQYFREQKRPQMIIYGKNITRKRLRTLSEQKLDIKNIVPELIRDYFNEKSEDDFYVSLAEGRITDAKLSKHLGQVVVMRLLPSEILSNKKQRQEFINDLVRWLEKNNRINSDKEDAFFRTVGTGSVPAKFITEAIQQLTSTGLSSNDEVRERASSPSVDYDLFAHTAQCCFPIPGDAIIGYVTVGSGLTIHRVSCPNVLSAHRQSRLVDIDWPTFTESISSMLFSAELFIIFAGNDATTYRKIEEAVLKTKGVIRELAPMGSSKLYSQTRLVVNVRDAIHLGAIKGRIMQIGDIFDVRRGLDD